MGEPGTKSELGQVLAAIASMQGDIQAMDKKLEVHIATTAEKFNTIEAKIDALDAKVDDLGKRQISTDNRLWAFLVALFFTMAGLLAKVTLFDKV